MAHQSKKRKAPPQSTTLHNFFSPDAIAAKKGQTLPTVPQKMGKRRATTRTSDEVIVIDSDSDHGQVTVSTKKGKGKKRSESSEVEFVPEPAADGPSNHKLKNNRTPKGAGSSFGVANVVAKSEMSSAILDDEDTLSFGEPSSLLRSLTSPVKPGISSFDESSDLLRPRRASSPSLFGAPVSLLRDEAGPSKSQDDISMAGPSCYPSFEATHRPSRPSVYPIQGTASSSSNYTDSSVKTFDDDDWATGDDEMALVDPETDEEDMEEIEIESSSPEVLQEDSEGVATCPICALRLVGLFVTVSRLVSSSCPKSDDAPLTVAGSRSCQQMHRLVILSSTAASHTVVHL
jgi:hypothetical protein